MKITAKKAKNHPGLVIVTCWTCKPVYRITTTPSDVARIRANHTCKGA